MKTISILLVLLTATSPLLAINPCQAECLAPSPVAPTGGVHDGQHCNAHSNAGCAEHSGLSISMTNCGSHVAVALQLRTFLLFGAGKTWHASPQIAAVASFEAPIVQNAYAGGRNEFDFRDSHLAPPIPLRV